MCKHCNEDRSKSIQGQLLTRNTYFSVPLFSKYTSLNLDSPKTRSLDFLRCTCDRRKCSRSKSRAPMASEGPSISLRRKTSRQLSASFAAEITLSTHYLLNSAAHRRTRSTYWVNGVRVSFVLVSALKAISGGAGSGDELSWA